MAQSAYPFTGSGGGGGTGASSFGNIAWTKGGNGGPGICVMRYQIGAIGESPTAPTGQQAKATGGNISFYNGKAIHTFVNPDNFVTDAGFNETIEWVAVGGGGGGGRGGRGGRGWTWWLLAVMVRVEVVSGVLLVAAVSVHIEVVDCVVVGCVYLDALLCI